MAFIPSFLTSEGGHFQVVHLGERDHERELIVLHVELEERPAADDLERRQHDPRHVHVRDEDVARDLTDVRKEAQVQRLVLHS